MNELAINDDSNISKYFDSKVNERRWKIVYRQETFYFTTEEKDFLLKCIENKIQAIRIGELVLFERPVLIYPVRDAVEEKTYEFVEGKAVEKVG